MLCEKGNSDIMKKTKNISEKEILENTTKVSGIYKIINKVNGKYYVGSSGNILNERNNRWYFHLNDLKHNRHHSILLQRAWNKYGEDSFDWIVVEECPKNKLLMVEQKFGKNGK